MTYNLSTTRLHRGRPRKVMSGQKIHKSVFGDDNYKPKARIQVEGIMWENVESSAEMIEEDPFTDASVVLDGMRGRSPPYVSEEDFNVFMTLSQTPGESRSGYEVENDRYVVLFRCWFAEYHRIPWGSQDPH